VFVSRLQIEHASAQSASAQQLPWTERSTQRLSAVPESQQVSPSAQQSASMLLAPGQIEPPSSQQKSLPEVPPKQSPSQQPSTAQQTSGSKQHSPVPGQISAIGGSPPVRRLVGQQSSSPWQVPLQQALSQHSL